MSGPEQLYLRMAALQLRVQKLEVAFAALATADRDARRAGDVAAELGYDVAVLVVTGLKAERRRLALALSGLGWSAERIARSLRCSEKTVDRWLKAARRCRDTGGIADCRLPIAD